MAYNRGQKTLGGGVMLARNAEKETALQPSKVSSAAPVTNLLAKDVSMNPIINRRPPSMPRPGTAASTALVVLIEAGPVGVCPQQFFDLTGCSLKHAVHDLRRMRWCIESRWSRQRVESEISYVLTGGK